MITKGYKQLVDEAEAVIETLSVEAAKNLHGDENVTFVDIRDVREVKREGKVAGALHAPRGMLEFWVDPDSPYHRDVFATGNKVVLYCASAWRSALAAKALQEMGFGPVAHIGGGFTAWKEADGPMDAPE
jgi:rhodanese-related sulfurtransferase